MIVHWLNGPKKTTFKFIGYSAESSSNDDVIVIKKHLGTNDNINTICKKLLVHLHKYIKITSPDNIYLWRHKKVSSNIALHFIENVFQYESSIDKKYLATCIENTFGKTADLSKYNMIDKSMALHIMSKLKYSTMVEPLMFRYTKNGFIDYSLNYDASKAGITAKQSISDYLPLTLGGDVEEFNMVINDGKINSAYFPLETHVLKYQDLEKFINQIDKAEQKILGHELVNEFTNNTYISFAYFKSEHRANNINLHVLFDKFHVSSTVPFIKLKTRNNIFYKVHKASLVNIEQKNLEKWTTFHSSIQLISFKIVTSKKSFCTLTITELGEINIKFNLSINDRIKYKQVCKFFKTTLTELFSNYISLEIEDYKCLNMITYNVIAMETSVIKYDKIKDIIESSFYLYFNIIPNPDKNILHMQYKKVDNYSKYDNIQNFILQYYTLPKDQVIAKLIENFSFSKQEAELEYDKWANKSELEAFNVDNKTGKKKLKLRYDNFVNIKLRVTESIDAKFMISGLKDYKIMYDILKLLNILFDQQKVSKIAAINPEEIDKVVYDAHAGDTAAIAALGDLGGLAALGDLGGLAALGDLGDLADLADLGDLGVDDFENITDIEEAMKEFEVPPSKAISAAKGKIAGYVLEMLHKADSDLFEYKNDNTHQSYAIKCGAVDKRQPIVITQKIKDNIDQNYPGAYDNHVHTGSTPELAKKNIYICPKVWCPKSKIAMNYEQYETAGKKCPFADEKPILAIKDNETDAELRAPTYVQFMPYSMHPDKFCLPCCYKTKQPANDCIANYKNDAKNETASKLGNEKYIKADTYFPLDKNRYGLLPKEISTILGGENCGNRHDGTGLIKKNSTCYLRKGITHYKSSFLECISAVLNIKDNFLQLVLEKLTIINFMALENGKIIRLFINDDFTIHDANNFLEFKTWFLDQKKYIKKFNLVKVQKELEKDQVSKNVIREFMIYNSFKHYKMFLESDQVKDHRIMLDFININFNEQHFIIVEVNPKTGKCVILCPYNRRIKNAFNPLKPVFIIIKNNTYYEPLCQISVKNSTIESTFAFDVYKDLKIKKIVDFYVNNCANDAEEEDLTVFIESLATIRAYVVDFNFLVRGVLTRDNLYIPFVNKLEIYTFTNRSFIYYSDIVDFKCLLTRDKIKEFYNKILKYTGNDFYKIAKFITSKEQISAIVLKTGTVIPIQMKRSSLLMQNFENDLQIFIQEKTSIKKSQIRNVNFNKVLELIEKDEELKTHVEFLTADHNPFPKTYRRDKLRELLPGIEHELVEMLLTGSKMVKISKAFAVNNDEALLDQYDITNNRLLELIENQKNPFRLLSEKLVAEFQDDTYKIKDNIYNPLLNYTQDDLKNLPIRFKSVLSNCSILKMNYDPTVLYTLFMNINSIINPNRKIDNVNLLKTVIRTRLINDYKTDRIKQLFDRNESFVKLHGGGKLNNKPSLEKCIEIFDSTDYYISFYELEILSQIIGVNLIILGRISNVKRPDGIEVLTPFNNSLPFTLIMVHNHDGINKLERFELVVKNDKTGGVFKNTEISKDLINTTKKFVIHVDDE